jgi:twitching motility protein PilJ
VKRVIANTQQSFARRSKQLGFGKPAVILFLLLVLSLIAAAFCFIQANLKTDRNHLLASKVAELKSTAASVVLNSIVSDAGDEVAVEMKSGDSILDALRKGDRALNIPAIPAVLDTDLRAVNDAWTNLVGSMQLPNATLEASALKGEVHAKQLDTLIGLSATLGRWLIKIKADKKLINDHQRLAKAIDALKLKTAQFEASKREALKSELGGLWLKLDAELRIFSAENNKDIRIIYNEMRIELDQLKSLYGSGQSNEALSQSFLTTQYSKNSELQFLLDKLQAAVGVLKHEQHYLFRLGVVAALMSLLFLFILAIVFWRDAKYKITKSQQLNTLNQRAILRLLDEITDLAEGDLSVRATVTEDITGAIADSVNYAVETIRNLVLTINGTASRVASAANETAKTAKRLSRASTLQEREVRRSSNYITAMSNTMKQMSERAAEAKEVASQSVLHAKTGSAAVSETILGMEDVRQQIQDTSKRLKRLGESSQQIGEIINLVNDIAEKTNLLALNAAIQASSQTSQSQFSPVVDEVQKLSERVNEATRDIEGLIVTIQADTRAAIASMDLSTAGVVKGSSLAEKAGVTLNDIQLVSRKLAEKIQTISDKASRQAEVTVKLSGNMKVISDIAQQTDKGMHGTADSIADLQTMSSELTSMVSGFILPESDLPPLISDLEQLTDGTRQRRRKAKLLSSSDHGSNSSGGA